LSSTFAVIRPIRSPYTIFDFKGQLTNGITTKTGTLTDLWSPTKASGTAIAVFSQNAKCELPDKPVHWTAHLLGGDYYPGSGLGNGGKYSKGSTGVAQPGNASRG